MNSKPKLGRKSRRHSPNSFVSPNTSTMSTSIGSNSSKNEDLSLIFPMASAVKELRKQALLNRSRNNSQNNSMSKNLSQSDSQNASLNIPSCEPSPIIKVSKKSKLQLNCSDFVTSATNSSSSETILVPRKKINKKSLDINIENFENSFNKSETENNKSEDNLFAKPKAVLSKKMPKKSINLSDLDQDNSLLLVYHKRDAKKKSLVLNDSALTMNESFDNSSSINNFDKSSSPLTISNQIDHELNLSNVKNSTGDLVDLKDNSTGLNASIHNPEINLNTLVDGSDGPEVNTNDIMDGSNDSAVLSDAPVANKEDNADSLDIPLAGTNDPEVSSECPIVGSSSVVKSDVASPDDLVIGSDIAAVVLNEIVSSDVTIFGSNDKKVVSSDVAVADKNDSIVASDIAEIGLIEVVSSSVAGTDNQIVPSGIPLDGSEIVAVNLNEVVKSDFAVGADGPVTDSDNAAIVLSDIVSSDVAGTDGLVVGSVPVVNLDMTAVSFNDVVCSDIAATSMDDILAVGLNEVVNSDVAVTGTNDHVLGSENEAVGLNVLVSTDVSDAGTKNLVGSDGPIVDSDITAVNLNVVVSSDAAVANVSVVDSDGPVVASDIAAVDLNEVVNSDATGANVPVVGSNGPVVDSVITAVGLNDAVSSDITVAVANDPVVGSDSLVVDLDITAYSSNEVPTSSVAVVKDNMVVSVDDIKEKYLSKELNNKVEDFTISLNESKENSISLLNLRKLRRNAKKKSLVLNNSDYLKESSLPVLNLNNKQETSDIAKSLVSVDKHVNNLSSIAKKDTVCEKDLNVTNATIVNDEYTCGGSTNVNDSKPTNMNEKIKKIDYGNNKEMKSDSSTLSENPSSLSKRKSDKDNYRVTENISENGIENNNDNDAEDVVDNYCLSNVNSQPGSPETQSNLTYTVSKTREMNVTFTVSGARDNELSGSCSKSEENTDKKVSNSFKIVPNDQQPKNSLNESMPKLNQSIDCSEPILLLNEQGDNVTLAISKDLPCTDELKNNSTSQDNIVNENSLILPQESQPLVAIKKDNPSKMVSLNESGLKNLEISNQLSQDNSLLVLKNQLLKKKKSLRLSEAWIEKSSQNHVTDFHKSEVKIINSPATYQSINNCKNSDINFETNSLNDKNSIKGTKGAENTTNSSIKEKSDEDCISNKIYNADVESENCFGLDQENLVVENREESEDQNPQDMSFGNKLLSVENHNSIDVDKELVIVENREESKDQNPQDMSFGNKLLSVENHNSIDVDKELVIVENREESKDQNPQDMSFGNKLLSVENHNSIDVDKELVIVENRDETKGPNPHEIPYSQEIRSGEISLSVDNQNCIDEDKEIDIVESRETAEDQNPQEIPEYQDISFGNKLLTVEKSNTLSDTNDKLDGSKNNYSSKQNNVSQISNSDSVNDSVKNSDESLVLFKKLKGKKKSLKLGDSSLIPSDFSQESLLIEVGKETNLNVKNAPSAKLISKPDTINDYNVLNYSKDNDDSSRTRKLKGKQVSKKSSMILKSITKSQTISTASNFDKGELSSEYSSLGSNKEEHSKNAMIAYKTVKATGDSENQDKQNISNDGIIFKVPNGSLHILEKSDAVKHVSPSLENKNDDSLGWDLSGIQPSENQTIKKLNLSQTINTYNMRLRNRSTPKAPTSTKSASIEISPDANVQSQKDQISVKSKEYKSKSSLAITESEDQSELRVNTKAKRKKSVTFAKSPVYDDQNNVDDTVISLTNMSEIPGEGMPKTNIAPKIISSTPKVSKSKRISSSYRDTDVSSSSQGGSSRKVDRKNMSIQVTKEYKSLSSSSSKSSNSKYSPLSPSIVPNDLESMQKHSIRNSRKLETTRAKNVSIEDKSGKNNSQPENSPTYLSSLDGSVIHPPKKKKKVDSPLIDKTKEKLYKTDTLNTLSGIENTPVQNRYNSKDSSYDRDLKALRSITNFSQKSFLQDNTLEEFHPPKKRQKLQDVTPKIISNDKNFLNPNASLNRDKSSNNIPSLSRNDMSMTVDDSIPLGYSVSDDEESSHQPSQINLRDFRQQHPWLPSYIFEFPDDTIQSSDYNITSRENEANDTKDLESLHFVFRQPKANRCAPKLAKPAKWVNKKFYDYLFKKLKPRYGIEYRKRSEDFVIFLHPLVESVKLLPTLDLYGPLILMVKEKVKELGICTNWGQYNWFCSFLPCEFKAKSYSISDEFENALNPLDPF